MKKYKSQLMLIVSLFSLLFLLSACGENNGTDPLEINYYSGSDGLVFSFLPNNPPEKVYPDQIYPIALQIENKGAFDILSMSEQASTRDYTTQIVSFYDRATGAKMDMYGQVNIVYDSIYFSKEGNNNDESSRITLRGKSLAWPFGEMKMQIVDVIKAQSLVNRKGAQTSILASLCYPYKTTLAHEVCIDKDPYDNEDEQVVCHAEDISLSDQGAPVAITYINFESTYAIPQTINGQSIPQIRPMFILTIENVGDGQIVRARERGEQKLCVKRDADDDPSNSVRIEAEIAGKKLDCNPKIAVLYNEQVEVVCTLPADDSIPVESNYKEIFIAELFYVYQIREQIDIEIDDIAGTLKPITILDYRCNDFNDKYDLCKAYSRTTVLEEISGANSLNCYYCEENKRCLESGQRSECPGATGSDDLTRRFVPNCPAGLASPSAKYDSAKNIVSFTCSDPSGVEEKDSHRCGCDKVFYRIANASGDCPDLPGDYSSRMTNVGPGLSISLPDLVVDALQTTSYTLCYGASTFGKESYTDPKKLVIQPVKS